MEKLKNFALAANTPNYQNFVGIYSEETIESDKRRVAEVKRKVNYAVQEREKRSTFAGIENAELAGQLESAVLNLVTDEDLFEEWTADENGEDLLSDEDTLALRAEHTSEYDDWCNHSDLVCVAKNRMTGGRAIPFVLDTTYNADYGKISEKFRWRHFRRKDLPGLISLKYYEDIEAADEEEAVLPRGRIDMLPRFVVGFNPDLLGDRSEAGDFKRRLCLLAEITEQSRAMLATLDARYPEGGQVPADVMRMRTDMATLNRYFRRAYGILGAKLREASTEQAEFPMSPYYQNPDGLYKEVVRYPNSNAEPAFATISMVTEMTHSAARKA